MTCRATHYDAISGLHIDTWSGLDKQNGKPRIICTIDDFTMSAHHIVEVASAKTYSRQIFVKGSISSEPKNRALFKGHLVSSETEWKDATILTSARSSATLGMVQIIKKIYGDEIIKVEIEYEDAWNPGVLKAVDPFSNNLIFEIRLR